MTLKTVIKENDRFGLLTTCWSWIHNKTIIWKCLCDCGNVCYVKEVALLNHVVNDCGCGCSKSKSREIDRSKLGKNWTIQSPDGSVYNLYNLKLWCIQNSHLLPTTPMIFYNSIVLLKRHMKNNLRTEYTYKGWKLIDYKDECQKAKEVS